VVGAKLARRPELLAQEIVQRDLPPSRWLFEYRADALVRHASEIARAATLLGSRQHGFDVCLLGIESFAISQLDRFNKGYGPEVNLQALRLLRQLEEDHPGAFRFRPYGGLSTILFDPWSTAAEIALNLAVVLHFRIEHLCGKLLTSRLRLEEGLPLSTRARMEGLIRGAYDDDALDTAAHNFYPDEIPWRFRDGRLEPFVRLVLRLARTSERPVAQSSSSADKLAEQLQRWQRQMGQTDVQLATELLRDVHVGPDHDSPEELLRRTQSRLQRAKDQTEHVPSPAIATGYDDDSVDNYMALAWAVRAFRAGLKPVVELEDGLSPAAQSGIVARLKAEWPGLHVAQRQSLRQGPNTCELFLGRRLSEVREALELTEQSEGQCQPAELRDIVTRIGQLLGYPECCARAFATEQHLFRGNNEWLQVARRVATPGEVDRAFEPGRLDYVPCSLSCAESLRRMEILRSLASTPTPELHIAELTLILLDVPGASFHFEPLGDTVYQAERVVSQGGSVFHFQYRPTHWHGLSGDDEKALLAGATLVVEPGLVRVEDQGRELAYFPLNAFLWWHAHVLHRDFWEECLRGFVADQDRPRGDTTSERRAWVQGLGRGLRHAAARRPELLADFSPVQIEHRTVADATDEVVVTLRRADEAILRLYVFPKELRPDAFRSSAHFSLTFGPEVDLSDVAKRQLAQAVLAVAEGVHCRHAGRRLWES
jgi:hypothetical protein